MKKFIALLMIGGLLLTGCGQQAPAPEQKEDVATVAEEETPTEEVISGGAVVASDSAIDVTNESAETGETETDEMSSLENPSELNIITTHDATDPAADNSVDYFPEIKDLVDLETTLSNILPSTFNFKDYEYSIEHRRFDFLKSGDDVTYDNLISAGDYAVNEYLTEENIPSTDFTTGRVIESTTNYYRAYIGKQPEIDYTKDYTDEELQNLLNINYTVVYAVKTINDANNGLSVLIIKDVPNQELPI